MRVLHLMVYDGPGGYCRVIYDLCRLAEASRPRVAVFWEGEWTKRIRAAGIRVDVIDDIVTLADPDERMRRLDQLFADTDLLNVHVGPELWGGPAAFVDAAEIPCAITLHYGYRVPVTRRHIICVAPWLAALQRSSNRCHVIPNGVDLDRYHPPRKRDVEKPILIRTCRAERTPRYFWDAVEPVLARHSEARLWIVGETANSNNPQIKFWGYRDDVPRLLRAATILVHAPRPNEGAHDLAILEAMASGVVPVVTDVSSVGGSVTRGRDGVLVPYGDVLALERALERLVRRPSLVRSLGIAARATAERRYDIRQLVRRHERTYAQIIARPRP